MNDMEIYFARQNILWNIAMYFLLIIVIIGIILFVWDLISQIKYKNFMKKNLQKFDDEFKRRKM